MIILKTLPLYGQGFSFIENYNSENEIIEDLQILSISQDDNGWLYFANHLGVLNYDGNDWYDFHIGESGQATVIKNTSLGLLSGGDDKLGWIENDSLNNPIYAQIFGERDKLATYWEIHENNNQVYVRSFYYLDILNNQEIKSVSHPGLSSSFKIENEIIYHEFQGGLAKMIDNEFQTLPNTDDLKNNAIRFMAEINDEIIIGSDQFGFKKYTEDKLIDVFPRLSELAQNLMLYTFLKLRNGNFVLATKKGGVILCNENGEIITIIDETKGLNSNSVYALYEDHESNLWVGTEKGYAKIILDNGFYSIQGNSNTINDISNFITQKNDIWVSNAESAYLLKKKNYDYEVVQIENLLPRSNFNKFGNNILVSNDLGLFVTKNDRLVPLIDGEINSIITNTDKVYAISNNSLYVYDENLKLSSESEFHETMPIIYSQNGELFFNSFQNIYTFGEDSNLVEIPIITENSDKTINHLDEINGELFLATNSGLFNFDSINRSFNKDTLFFEDENQVFWFKQCTETEIWFNHNKEIKRARIDSNGLTYAIDVYKTLGLGKTIYDIECADDGTVWFAGTEGLFHLTDPDWEYTSTFKTNITGVFVNQDSLIYGGFGEPVHPIVLPYEDNQLRFTYAAASYVDESRNTYSIMLEGFDTKWSEWSLETQKDYTNIPEGDYVFKVRSRNVFEVDGVEDAISFTVLPPWFRTWWAYLLYVISVSGLLYAVHRIRLNQLLKVERMRTKIASDLHDEVSATLTGISYFAEAVKADQNEERKSHFINLITESAGDAKEKITDIVWSITPENDNWELFLSKCRRYASDLLESGDIKYNLSITHNIEGALPMNVRQHLWMIFKEMLTNVVRHSGADQVDVILDTENNVLKLIVQDNGLGFDANSKRIGNGVQNIKKRAGEIGATIDLISEPEMGTRWRLELPL